MQKILIPTDFSTTARNAICYAHKYTADINTEYTLVHTYKQPATEEMLISVEDILREEGEKHLQDELRFCVEELNIDRNKISLCLEHGDLDYVLKEKTRSESFDLIVMGTTGAHGLKEFLIGTNTVSVIESSNVPVLAVPFNRKENNLNTLLIALDSEGLKNEEKLFTARLLAQKNKTQNIIVINVSNENNDPLCANVQCQNKIKKYFGRLDVSLLQLNGSNVENEISEFALNNDVGMIVLFPRKKSIFQKLFGKRSVTKKINFHSSIPILSVG